MSERTGRGNADRLLEALSDHRRRHLLVYMEAADGEVFSLGHLAEVLVDLEAESAAADDEQRTRTKIDLHHRHLPKMDAAGFLEYDPKSGDVRYRGTTESDLVGELSHLDSARIEEEIDALSR